MNAPADTLRTERVLVTPELARQWLLQNRGNRTVRARAVTRLATVIRDGGWQVTHQGVAFMHDGRLADGQHRLMAVVQAGIAVEMMVTWDLGHAQLVAIDNGGASTRDAFDVVGFADGTRVDSHVRGWIMGALELSENGHLMAPAARSVRGARAAIQLHLADAMLLRSAMSGTIGREPPAAVMGALIIARVTDPDAVDAFARAVKTGENLARYSPALALREYLSKSVGHSTGATGREATSLRAFAALDAQLSGQPVKTLRGSTGARDRFLAAWKRSTGGAA